MTGAAGSHQRAMNRIVWSAVRLRRDEWIQLDAVVLKAARMRSRAWADLQVEVCPFVGVHGHPVLRDQDEGRKENRFHRSDHRKHDETFIPCGNAGHPMKIGSAREARRRRLKHGGSIEVDTEPGVFTEFKIVLPRASQR